MTLLTCCLISGRRSVRSQDCRREGRNYHLLSAMTNCPQNHSESELAPKAHTHLCFMMLNLAICLFLGLKGSRNNCLENRMLNIVSPKFCQWHILYFTSAEHNQTKTEHNEWTGQETERQHVDVLPSLLSLSAAMTESQGECSAHDDCLDSDDVLTPPSVLHRLRRQNGKSGPHLLCLKSHYIAICKIIAPKKMWEKKKKKTAKMGFCKMCRCCDAETSTARIHALTEGSDALFLVRVGWTPLSDHRPYCYYTNCNQGRCIS